MGQDAEFVLPHINKKTADSFGCFYKNTYLCSRIVLWCNGSTTGFGSVCGGSNPPRTTFVKRGSSSKEWLPLLRLYISGTQSLTHFFCTHFLHTYHPMCARQKLLLIRTDINQLITFSHKKLLNPHIIFNIDTLTLQCVRENTTFFH